MISPNLLCDIRTPIIPIFCVHIQSYTQICAQMIGILVNQGLSVLLI